MTSQQPTSRSTSLPVLRENFDADWYLRVNPDVRDVGMDAWAHYVAYGFDEGRAGAPLRAIELEHVLWRGFAREAEAELRLLIRGPDAHEQAAAGWVLARYAASKGKWRTALAAIMRFVDAPAAAQSIRHQGPWLLAVQSAARQGKPAEAQRIRTAALQRAGIGHSAAARIKAGLGYGPPLTRDARELELAALEIEGATGASEAAMSLHLAKLYARTGLKEVNIAKGTDPRFDRLTTRTPPKPVHTGPLVSVIVPACNAEQTIATSLRGLIAQSWRGLEIIVVDDCSTDGTAQIVAAAAREDQRIRLLRLTEKGGAYGARNAGCEAAGGTFLTVHDADDWSHPQKIEAQVTHLIEKPALTATASHWVRMDDDLRMTRWRMEDGWIHRNVSSLMIRRDTLNALGYWDRVRANADTEYYHRLLAAFGADAFEEVHSGIPLSFGRTHSGALTQQAGCSVETQINGPRRTYMNAAYHWHRQSIAALPDSATQTQRAAALHMAAKPQQRRFFAPPDIGPSEPNAPADEYSRVAASPYFVAAWYQRRNPDVLTADVDPVAHYLAHGTRENRDAGPLFPTALWRRTAHGAHDVPTLLGAVEQQRFPALPAAIAGAVEQAGDPVVLVFAHAAELEVFGAERSFLLMLERLAQGYDGAPVAPVVVLPSAVNERYIHAVAARAVAVEVLPQVWRHRFRPAPPQTVETIRALIRRYGARAVHVNTLVLDAPLEAARAEGCPSVVHIRELPAQDAALCRILGDTAHGLRRHLLREADRFTANSRAVADWIDCPDRTVIWPNAVDPALRTLPFSPEPSVRVGLVSSNIAKKGIADFIGVATLVAQMEAMADVPAHQRCRFSLIGPATPDLAALSPLPPNTIHAGYAETPMAAMAQCDLVLVMSHFAESFGRTALEALTAGRPVICYGRGTPPGFIKGTDAGVVVPPDDQEAAARAVFALASAPDKLAEMSLHARAVAKRYGSGPTA